MILQWKKKDLSPNELKLNPKHAHAVTCKFDLCKNAWKVPRKIDNMNRYLVNYNKKNVLQ
jgi:hypothetical protein